MKRENIFKTIAVALIAISAASCSVLQKTAEIHSAVRTYEPISKATIVKPMVVDLEIISTARVIDTWVFSVDDCESSGLEALKTEALAKSAKQHDADIIMAPVINSKIEDQKVEIEVRGYAANYTKWRSFEEEEDAQWVKDMYWKELGIVNCKPLQKEKRNK